MDGSRSVPGTRTLLTMRLRTPEMRWLKLQPAVSAAGAIMERERPREEMCLGTPHQSENFHFIDQSFVYVNNVRQVLNYVETDIEAEVLFIQPLTILTLSEVGRQLSNDCRRRCLSDAAQKMAEICCCWGVCYFLHSNYQLEKPSWDSDKFCWISDI